MKKNPGCLQNQMELTPKTFHQLQHHHSLSQNSDRGIYSDEKIEGRRFNGATKNKPWKRMFTSFHN